MRYIRKCWVYKQVVANARKISDKIKHTRNLTIFEM